MDWILATFPECCVDTVIAETPAITPSEVLRINEHPDKLPKEQKEVRSGKQIPDELQVGRSHVCLAWVPRFQQQGRWCRRRRYTPSAEMASSGDTSRISITHSRLAELVTISSFCLNRLVVGVSSLNSRFSSLYQLSEKVYTASRVVSIERFHPFARWRARCIGPSTSTPR